MEKSPAEGLKVKGGARANLVKEISKKILKDKAIKIALISLFATIGIQHFQEEVEELLAHKVFDVYSY